MIRWSGGTSILKWVIGGATIVGFAYFTFYLPVEASHGEKTVIEQSVRFLADISAQVWIAWGVGAAGAAYGYREKQLRHKERAERDKRIRELERQHDPNVTSSGLNSAGTQSENSK